MKRLLISLTTILLAAITLCSQSVPQSVRSPKETVEQLWRMAVRGDLLTDEGWVRAGWLFTEPTPPPSDKEIIIMSNDYAVLHDSVKDKDAEVGVECENAGKIDATLKYIAPVPTGYQRSGMLYRLVFTPAHWARFKPDGKIEKQIGGPMEWHIVGQPGKRWTTVNTAIRYVLEMRDKTTDPMIKRNADQTLAKLKQLH